MYKTNLIFARSKNNIIGNANKLPWHLPDDLKEFKEKTHDRAVWMGRKTWESLPSSVRPLRGRFNAVLSKNKEFLDKLNSSPTIMESDDSGELVYTFTAATADLRLLFSMGLDCDKDQWVIGGRSLFTQCMPYASEIHVTEVLIEAEGDTYGPVIPDDFEIIYKSRIKHDSVTNIPYFNLIYKRTSPCQTI